MKKTLRLKKIILCGALTAAISSSYAVYAAGTLAGDINSDGSLNASDLVSMKRYLLGMAEPDENGMKNADMNDDGNVNIVDCILLINKLLDSADVPDQTEANVITLSGESISFTGSGAQVNGSVITVTAPGTYSVTGKLSNGQIIVDVDKEKYPEDKVELSLEGAEISCSDNSPVYIASVGDECVITVKKGTENVISDGKEYTNADGGTGAVYSKDDLKIKGKGKLTVNGNCADGIIGKDSVKIFNGNITVNAADDGITGKDSVKIGDSDDTDFSSLVLTVVTESGDGIKATNDSEEDKGKVIINGGTVSVRSFGDAIQGVSDVKINGGDIDIYTYKGSSYTASGNTSGGNTGGWGGMGMDGNANKMPDDLSAKGIKSAGTINITGGSIVIDSSDDAIHGAGNVNLFGGKMQLSSADDAAHSDADLTIGNGTAGTYDDVLIYAPKCYEGIEGKNIYQKSGTCIIYSDDDGYNAAGGADGSGNTAPGGWNQGGWGGGFGGGMGASDNVLSLTGGFAYVSAADGDHDGFDSNGSITIDGAVAVSNGNEAFDCDGTKTFSSGTFVQLSGSSSGGFGGRPGGMGGNSSGFAASFTSSISAQKGNRITVCDPSGNVIVSFVAGKNATSCSVGSKTVSSGTVNVGGTVTGGTELPSTGDSQKVYIGGKYAE